MNKFVGIDLGTSSVKMLLVGADGTLLSSVKRSYEVFYPQSGWSEQNPEDWWSAVKDGLDELLAEVDRATVRGISLGGQMHGLVALDADGNVVRPAILWNDGRTQKQTDYLNTSVGKSLLSELTANVAFAGFTAPKLMWLKQNEPLSYAKIARIMLPKDYIVYKLTGKISTDYSDASGTLLLDVKNKCWSKKMCEICSVKTEWLPRLYESSDIVGKALDELALPNAIVTAGAGDNAAAAIGVGAVRDGDCNLSLGTSGTLFVCGDSFSVDEKNALHSLVHANGKWHLMGCILSAASCNQWWTEVASCDYADGERAAEKLGNNEVFFLPYLMGERSPHNDTEARGAFIGLCANTKREEMSLAVLEGVAFALRDCLEVARANGITVNETTVCGGGAKSELWRKIIANALNLTVNTVVVEEGPAYGAAILAMVGAGEYANVADATAALVKRKESIRPTPELVSAYEEKYRRFKKLYPALRQTYAQ